MRKDYESELLRIIRSIVCTESTDCVQNAPERTEKLKILAKRHQVDHLVSYAYYCKGDAEATNDFFSSIAFIQGTHQAYYAQRRSDT